MVQPITTGRVLMTIGNLAYAVGAFIADWSETHVLNPRWPPHAKFHNGQTMSLGMCLASTSLYLLYRPASSRDNVKDNLFIAALVGSWYCVAGLTAILYPGTDWQDPEYRVEPNGVQGYVFGAIVAIIWIGYFVENRRTSNLKLA